MSQTGAAPLQPLQPLGDRLAAFLAGHQFYSFRDLLTEVFADDTDAFADAYCSGVLPKEVRIAVEDTLSPDRLQLIVLRKVSRQLSALLAALQ